MRRATFAADAPREALAPLLEAVARGEAPPGASEGKRSKARWVLRVPHGAEVFWLKVYRASGWWARLRQGLGRSRARQEYRNLLRLRARGIPAVEALACFEPRGEGGVHDALLATRELSGASVLGGSLAELEPAARSRVLAELGRLARRIHDAGLWHRDLHAGNVLLVRGEQGASLTLVDVQKLRALGRALPLRLRAADLGVLEADLRGKLRAGEWDGVLDAYRGAGSRALSGDRLRDSVERAAERRIRVRLRSRGRRCVVESTGFRIERDGGARVYRRADVPLDTVRQALRLHASGAHRVESGRWSAVSRVPDLEGGPPAGPAPARRGFGAAESGAPARGPVAVKELVPRSLVDRLRPSHRAMRAWRGAHALLLRGVDTPAPLALVEERRFGLLRRAWFLQRWEEQVCAAPEAAARDDAVRRGLSRFADALRGAGIATAGELEAALLVRAGADGRAPHFLAADPSAFDCRGATPLAQDESEGERSPPG